MKGKKREPWRIIAGILGVGAIVCMWTEQNIASTYAALPKEQLLPMIVTSAAVTLLKVGAMAGGILLIRWIIGKCRNK